MHALLLDIKLKPMELVDVNELVDADEPCQEDKRIIKKSKRYRPVDLLSEVDSQSKKRNVYFNVSDWLTHNLESVLADRLKGAACTIVEACICSIKVVLRDRSLRVDLTDEKQEHFLSICSWYNRHENQHSVAVMNFTKTGKVWGSGPNGFQFPLNHRGDGLPHDIVELLTPLCRNITPTWRWTLRNALNSSLEQSISEWIKMIVDLK